MLIAASAILLVLGVLAYRRNLRPDGSGWLLAIRIAILLIFAAIFVGSVFSRVRTERPRRVAVMLDISQSMNAVGAESAAIATAEAFPMPIGATRQEWAFGDTAVRAEVRSPKPRAQIQTGRERTRIGTALKTVGKTRPGAVVLVSDGQDNGETDPAAAAHGIGVPVYTVGFGGIAKRNAGIEQVLLPAVVHSGETAEVQVRVAAAGFADEKTRVTLRGETKEVVLGQAMAEQDVPFRLVFDKPGRQVIEARLDSLMGENNYADNTRGVTVDVRPGRVQVAYVTNRLGPDTRMVLRALGNDERIRTESLVSVSGVMGHVPDSVDVFVLDDVAESGSPEVWQSIADRVRAGAGILVLAGSDFQPGPSIGRTLNGTVGSSQAGTYTPELTSEGKLLPWWGAAPARGQDGGGAVDLSKVPPFSGLRPLSIADTAGAAKASNPAAWLVAQENKAPLVFAGKAGRGKVVYVAAYPLWRWGFGPEEKPEQATPLSAFMTGVVRYLAEPDTSPFWLQVNTPNLYRGQPVRMTMRAVTPDGRPWTGLSVMVQATAETTDSAPQANPESGNRNPEVRSQARKPETVTVPMTETGAGVYEAAIQALGSGQYRALATVSTTDTVLGRATTEFVIADQSVELANTGMNEGMLRAISEASGGRFFTSDSLPRDGSEIVLGAYQRRFVFDPRRAIWAYVLIALLAGAEWLLRRRRGML